jgi:hypothetical protein
MSDTRNPDVDELLGAYALNALDPIEHAQVDEYLRSSTEARAEVDELRETAAMLALTPTRTERAPAELWSRIAAEVAGQETDAAATVVPMRRRRWPLFVAPLSAAAAIAIVLLSLQVAHLNNQLRDARSPGAATAAAQFDRARNASGAQLATLNGAGSGKARIVLLPDGTGYLVNDALQPLPAGQSYQLWALVGDVSNPTAISAGVLGADPRAAAFKVSGPVVGFALTVENAGGVVQSQHKPVALGTLT